MKKKRILNQAILKEWMTKNGKGSLERLAYEAGLSASTLQHMMAPSYSGLPRMRTCDAICHVTGIGMEKLFPFVRVTETA